MCVPFLAVSLNTCASHRGIKTVLPLTATVRSCRLPPQAKSPVAGCSCRLQLHLLLPGFDPRLAPPVANLPHPAGCSIIRQRQSFGPCPCCPRPLRRQAPCRSWASASRASLTGPSLELPCASCLSLCPFWLHHVCKEPCLTIK